MPEVDVAALQYVNQPQAAQLGDEGSELPEVIALHHHQQGCLTLRPLRYNLFRLKSIMYKPNNLVD